MLSRPLALVLAGSAILIFAALRDPPALTVDVGSPGDERFVRGFHAAIGTDQTYRWSGPDSRLVLHGAVAGPHRLSLRADGGPSSRARLVSVATTAGEGGAGVVLGAFEAGPGWSVHDIDVSLPTVAWPPAGPVVLALTTASYRRGEDGALLGVKVDQVHLDRAPGQPLPPQGPLARAALVTWMLAVVGLLLERIGAVVLPDRCALREAGPAVAIGLATLVLAASTWRDPYRTAWLLPSTPILLVVATLALWLTRPRGASVTSPTPAPREARPSWGWALLIGAQILGWLQRAPVAAFALALAGAALVALHRPWPCAPAEDQKDPAPASHHRWALVAIFLLAAGMRLYRIEWLPYGMWRDEARIGLVGLRMIADHGYHPAYVPEVTLPGGGLYLLSLGIRACGVTPWSMRLVTALAGALTVFPLYGVVRRLMGRADVALLASVLLAASSWHVTVSRLSYPTALHPLFELVALWCLMVALPTRGEPPPPSARVRFLVLAAAGAFLGLAVQTYHSGRVSVFVAALLLLVVPRARPLTASGLAVIAIAFLLVAAPVAAFAWRHAGELNERLGQIFILSEAEKSATAPLTALDDSTFRHLLMFNVRGDVNGRRNVPRQPMVDPLTGVGLLAGLVALGRAPRDGRAAFLAGALVLELLPSLLAVEGPHAQRSLGALPYVCAIAAVGWVALFEPFRHRTWRWALLGSVAILVVGMNAWTYFVVMATDERSWGAFYTVPTQVGRYLRDRARPGAAAIEAPAYVDESLRGSVLEFLTSGMSVGTFDGETLAPAPGGPALLVLPSPLDAERTAALGARLGLQPAPVAFGPSLPDGRGPSFVVYQLR